MASYSFEVLNYSAFLNSKLLVNSAMGEHEAIPAQAMIQCHGHRGESLSVFFLNKERRDQLPGSDSDHWPNRAEITSTATRAEIFAPIEQYPFYIDLLRNERPVFAFVDSTQPANTKLSCRLEPVGEGE